MKAELKDGNLIITIPAETTNPEPSATGKTRIVATTKGNKETAVKVQGQNLIVGVNAYIKNR